MYRVFGAAVVAGVLAISGAAQAAPVDGIGGAGNVTPDAIFGVGNANGSFTGVRSNGIELGLRGKLRYNLSGAPENTFPYDGDRTYNFEPTDGNAPADRSVFSFEWSINADWDGSTGRVLNDLTYEIRIDYDPTALTDFTQTTIGGTPVGVFDPINTTWADHAIGDNSTPNGGGTVAASTVDYLALIGANNVAQNSWNLGFFDPAGFDTQTEGLYTIELAAFNASGIELASTSIDIRYGEVPPVPLPAGVWLLMGGVGAFAALRRAKRRADA